MENIRPNWPRAFEPRQAPWNSRDLLAPITRLERFPTDRDAYEPILWNDLCSEYDSRAMYLRLKTQDRPLSRDLKAVLEAWIADERNHAEGFARLYELVYGADEAAIAERLSRRVSNFTPIARWMTDEVGLCLLFAFDEIATFRSYVDDYQFYDAFGRPELSEWIRRVARDEGLHFTNFVGLVRRNPRATPDTCRRVVEEILEFDRNGREYGATFVLDHTGPQFTDAFLQDCAETLKQAVDA